MSKKKQQAVKEICEAAQAKEERNVQTVDKVKEAAELIELNEKLVFENNLNSWKG